MGETHNEVQCDRFNEKHRDDIKAAAAPKYKTCLKEIRIPSGRSSKLFVLSRGACNITTSMSVTSRHVTSRHISRKNAVWKFEKLSGGLLPKIRVGLCSGLLKTLLHYPISDLNHNSILCFRPDPYPISFA